MVENKTGAGGSLGIAAMAKAAPDGYTIGMVTAGTLFILPIILMYTIWSYWVFRGKVKADAGYH